METEWLPLTVVDLEVMDAQTLEDGHTLLQDVQRLAQLGVGCAVHSAHLHTPHSTEKGDWYWRLVPQTGGAADGC